MTDETNDELADEHDWEPDEQGLSLDELSRAYAEALGRGEDPYHGAEKDAQGDAATGDEDDEDDEAEETPKPQDNCEVSPLSILEAMLFVGHTDNEPLTSEQVASLMRGVSAQEVDELVVELNDLYNDQACPYEVASVGAGYRLAIRNEYAGLRDKFYGKVKEAKLSQAAIDVMAVVAYSQPVSRQQVEELRGKPSGGLLNQLVRRQLLRVEIVDEKPKKTLYHTTDRFLDLFGLSSLADLPRSRDLER